jgi:N-acetylglucosaminyl-diphospho-decaprenol L-rhamnosyltransferase
VSDAHASADEAAQPHEATHPHETTQPDGVRAVVVSYNTRELALPLLGDLGRELAGCPGSEIVVVDNASTDGSAAAIAEAYPGLTLVTSATNLGFGRAVNLGAREAKTRWLLLVNPDARIDSGAVSLLIETARERPGHGLYGGRFIDVARQTDEDSVAVLPTMSNLLAYATGVGPIARRLGWRSPPRRAAGSAVVIEVDALPGTFVLAETDAWRDVNGFDERYFMYAEDLDLCVRMGDTGRRPLYVPAATLRHIGGASSSSGGGKEVLKLTSLVTFVRGRWTPRRGRVATLLLLTGVGLRRLARVPFRTPTGRWETAWRERKRWVAGW